MIFGGNLHRHYKTNKHIKKNIIFSQPVFVVLLDKKLKIR